MAANYFFKDEALGEPSLWIGRSFKCGGFFYKVFDDEKACAYEARMLSLASGREGVVKIIDFGVLDARHADGTVTRQYAIKEEYVEGTFFESYKNPDADKGTALFLEFANILSGLYEKGILHNDIKPQNLVVSTDGKPVLIDFGISKIDNEPLQEFHLNITDVFSAPEKILRGPNPVSIRSDIYSFGYMMKYYMDKNMGVAAYSKAFRDICNKCKNSDAQKRYASFKEIAGTLTEAVRLQEKINVQEQPSIKTLLIPYTRLIKAFLVRLVPSTVTLLYIASACLLAFDLYLIFFVP